MFAFLVVGCCFFRSPPPPPKKKKHKKKKKKKKNVGCCLFVVFVFRVKCENHSRIDFSVHGSRRCCSLPQLNTLLFNRYIKLCTDKRIPSGERIDCVFLTFFFFFFCFLFCLFVCLLLLGEGGGDIFSFSSVPRNLGNPTPSSEALSPVVGGWMLYALKGGWMLYVLPECFSCHGC